MLYSKSVLRIDLNKDIEELYDENNKTLMTETQNTKNVEKILNIPCLWIEKINTVKTSIPLVTIYRSIEYSQNFVDMELEKTTLNCIWSH